MSILVTGGAGYIGSHTCVELLQEGYSVIIADNLSNSDASVIDRIESIPGKDVVFYEMDITDFGSFETIFENHAISGIIHFAGLKAVGESKEEPLMYYRNNLMSTINVGEMSKKYKVNQIIFSSSATVYGDNQVPFVEDMSLLPTTNPYGETKAMSERILKDLTETEQELAVSILRYFNPVGAHTSGLIGESPTDIPNNLMPYITRVAKGELSHLNIFGDDYPTEDGTGVRDYIHVVDLAKGHVAALKYMKQGCDVFNLGTGVGTSVWQLMKSFEQANDVKIPYEIIERRPGDIAECYADVTKANQELHWEAERDIVSMCRDAWNYEVNT